MVDVSSIFFDVNIFCELTNTKQNFNRKNNDIGYEEIKNEKNFEYSQGRLPAIFFNIFVS